MQTYFCAKFFRKEKPIIKTKKGAVIVVGNIGQSIEQQIDGAFDHLSKRLESIGLTLESIVKIDCLFRDIWDTPLMEEVIRDRFNGKYPARKSIQTEFAHQGGQDGLQFQLDAIAFKG